MNYSHDDYTDAEAEEGDALSLDAHQDHDEFTAGCDFCQLEYEALMSELALEAEAVRAEMHLDALIALFVIEPCAQDREAARRVN